MLDMKQEIGTEIKQELVKQALAARKFAPCGVCRQVLREFVDPNEFLVLLCKGDGSWKEMTLEELLPMGFGKENL